MNRKPVFDLVRRWLGRGFRPAEVEALDRAFDAAAGAPDLSVQDRASGVVQGGLPDRIGPAGLMLIKRFEGCARLRGDGRYAAYPDPGTGGAPWTIGWGATGAGIGPDTVWTRAQCDARLEADLVRYAGEVAAALGNAPRSQAQFDALVSFHYNTGAIARATLTRLHKTGRHDAAVQQFARWNLAGGRVMKGLVRRRAAEARLYRSGC